MDDWLPDPFLTPDALGMFSDGRSLYYDRAGNPITMGRWYDLRTYDYQVLAKTIVGSWEVSTVWVGLDMGIWQPPLIFETMVFEIAESQGWFGPYHESAFDGFQQRYATQTEAFAGHRATVLDVRQLFLPMVLG